ncbi:MAG: hypothetical protein E3J52_11085, partial [Promethearchaeota archaeon]
MIPTKIKTVEEYDKKLSELTYLACNCRPHNYKQSIIYKKLHNEVTEYDKYFCNNNVEEEHEVVE